MTILIAYGVVTVSMIALAIWLSGVLNGAPGGYHTKSDAPTLGDALRGLRASDLPVLWAMLRDWLKDLRAPAAASAPGEGTAPSTPGAVPLEVRVTASDGFPAVGIRAGKQPWPTADMPRLPEVMS